MHSDWKPTQVQIADGSYVASDSEAYRHFCEAQFILNLPSLQERQNFLSAIEAKRGKVAIDRIKDTMLALHEKAKA